jgi:hypothetical protein
MTDDLPQKFAKLIPAANETGALEHELLTLCKATPDSAWQVLALLDQYHRRGKISADLCRTIRHKIERQALGIEQYDAPTQPQVGKGGTVRAPGRGRVRTSPAVALTAVMLGVAASPALREVPKDADPAYAAAAASAQADQSHRGPEMISLSSDRYIVHPHQRVAEISVERTIEAGAGDGGGETSFFWWTRASGAKPNEDYVAGAPKLAKMAEGVSSVTLHVPILANPARHHIQMFYILIGRPGAAAALGPVHRAAVFIMSPD